MSHEPYPKTDRATPGSTPAQPPGGQSELERQRAEAEAAAGSETDEEIDTVETDPSETVPDRIADEAARSVDPRRRSRADLDQRPADEPTRPFPATGDAARPPSDDA